MKNPTGLYRAGQDENGNQNFDDPKAAQTDEKVDFKEAGMDGKGLKAGGDSQGKPEEKCVTNTDKVDREIRKLKEKSNSLSNRSSQLPGMRRKSGSWR
ncbi:hypothetical protein AALA98_11250 [Lachnospiraceae bacterium 45-W7]